MGAAAALRVGIIDASYDSMPLILHEVQARYPAGVLLPVVGAVAQGHGLRPRTRDHHLRASNVAAARLASDRRPYGKLDEPPRRIIVTIRAPPLHPPGAVVPYYGQGTGRLQTATG